MANARETLKRLATRASLQHAYKDHTISAYQLYQFAVNSINGMHICFVELRGHGQEAEVLEDRLSRSRTVPGTQKLHFLIPTSANTDEVKLFSSSAVSRREKVEVGSAPVLSPQATAINGYVTVAYYGECWLGCVVGAHETEHAITIKFIHTCIPASSFVYPEQEYLLDVDLSDVLTSVNETTATGRTYTLSRKEMQEASAALSSKTYVNCKQCDVTVAWIRYSCKLCGSVFDKQVRGSYCFRGLKMATLPLNLNPRTPYHFPTKLIKQYVKCCWQVLCKKKLVALFS